MKKSEGNILSFLTAGITVIAIAVVVYVSLNTMDLILKKLEVSQISRKYILAMETQGYLKEEARIKLLDELSEAGLKNIDIGGTTLQQVGYGENIYLCIKGKVSGWSTSKDRTMTTVFERKEYEVEEKRMSTAKN